MGNRLRVGTVLLCLTCIEVGSVSAGTRPAGLWEITTRTTWQKSPTVPSGAASAMKDSTRTSQVCLTQEMIDNFGALLPQSRGQCMLTNKTVDPGRITADYVCSGMMNGKGNLISTWTDFKHSTSSVHFIGTLRVGSGDEPIEWTTESTSAFKSENCGSVRPLSPRNSQP